MSKVKELAERFRERDESSMEERLKKSLEMQAAYFLQIQALKKKIADMECKKKLNDGPATA